MFVHKVGEKKFKCEICPYRSHARQNLKRHAKAIHQLWIPPLELQQLIQHINKISHLRQWENYKMCTCSEMYIRTEIMGGCKHKIDCRLIGRKNARNRESWQWRDPGTIDKEVPSGPETKTLFLSDHNSNLAPSKRAVLCKQSKIKHSLYQKLWNMKVQKDLSTCKAHLIDC